MEVAYCVLCSELSTTSSLPYAAECQVLLGKFDIGRFYQACKSNV